MWLLSACNKTTKTASGSEGDTHHNVGWWWWWGYNCMTTQIEDRGIYYQFRVLTSNLATSERLSCCCCCWQLNRIVGLIRFRRTLTSRARGRRQSESNYIKSSSLSSQDHDGMLDVDRYSSRRLRWPRRRVIAFDESTRRTAAAARERQREREDKRTDCAS